LKVHELLFLIWVIVFALWLFRQFAAYNRRRDE
jgi:hypothetical protein